MSFREDLGRASKKGSGGSFSGEASPPLYLIPHNRKIWRGGFSYVLNEEQEELLHKLRDFNTLRDNAGAWEENLLTAEELI